MNRLFNIFLYDLNIFRLPTEPISVRHGSSRSCSWHKPHCCRCSLSLLRSCWAFGRRQSTAAPLAETEHWLSTRRTLIGRVHSRSLRTTGWRIFHCEKVGITPDSFSPALSLQWTSGRSLQHRAIRYADYYVCITVIGWKWHRKARWTAISDNIGNKKSKPRRNM